MLSSPTLLTKNHQLDAFTCGVDSLDDWLKKRAFSNQVNGASRTYVVADEQKVVGYYCLASGALELNNAPSSIRRNMPNPIPVVILGRLAIDKAYQGKGIGVALLQDAVLRTAQAAGILGIRGLLVHALSAEAKAFYEHHGFVVSPTQPMTLILSLKKFITRGEFVMSGKYRRYPAYKEECRMCKAIACPSFKSSCIGQRWAHVVLPILQLVES